MTAETQGDLEQRIDTLVLRYGQERSALIPILQDVQEAYGFLSREAVLAIGERLRLPVSKIYGVATFYNQFRFVAPGRYTIQVCRGTACHVRGSAALVDAFSRELEVAAGATTKDGLFTLEVVACLGVCGLAPVICINGDFHAAVTPNMIKRIIRKYRKAAEADASASGRQ